FYRDLPGEIVPRVSRLRMMGIEEDLRVALVGENSPEMLLEMAALWQIGAVAVPLNYHLPETRLRQLTEMLDCRLVLCDPDRRGAWGGIPVESLAAEKPGQRVDLEDALTAFDPHRPATIIFTSGSTGEPRGAVHTLANHLHSAAGSAANIPLQPGDAWLLPLPLFHVGGLAIWVRCLLAGACVEIPTSKNLIGEIATGRISHLSLVATQLKRLMDEHPTEAALAGVKVLLLGGSAIPRALLAEGFRRGWPLVTSYGSTEMSSQITATRPGGSWQDLLTSGSVLPGRELSIAPDGEILVRGETRFLGYFRDGRIEDPCDSQGWLHTGDTGFLDEGERLTVRGRLDNMFICGGENIQPEEIEQILRAQPGVGEALVV
ncbi:MAG TPA: o-succinylbenzoate--CoA ligase, partial [Calditrichia bacterium]|nr:o-succinylbenzoate--CoA ligase [Calditrichia bacterium]